MVVVDKSILVAVPEQTVCEEGVAVTLATGCKVTITVKLTPVQVPDVGVTV
jgi:hypothetical protein